jgi:hypothetical protein
MSTLHTRFASRLHSHEVIERNALIAVHASSLFCRNRKHASLGASNKEGANLMNLV